MTTGLRNGEPGDRGRGRRHWPRAARPGSRIPAARCWPIWSASTHCSPNGAHGRRYGSPGCATPTTARTASRPRWATPAAGTELAAITGAEAERLVYFYASCDRRFSYPHLAEREGPFKDRFTGTVLRPPLRLRRDFAELTAANELDIAAVNPDLCARHGQDLLRLFTSWKALLSDAARQAAPRPCGDREAR